jgi:hypothetical protein
MSLPTIPFVKAKYFTKASGRKIDLIVIHSMEASEKGATAMNCARYFQTLTTPASAHYCISDTVIVQCVLDKDVAYGAPGANRNGLHFEHAGYARQTEAQWKDEFSAAMLRLSAQLVAVKCKAYNIPLVWLSAAEINAGKRGITTHARVTQATKRVGGHTDPGLGFPAYWYMQLVWQAAAATT